MIDERRRTCTSTRHSYLVYEYDEVVRNIRGRNSLVVHGNEAGKSNIYLASSLSLISKAKK